MKKLLRLFIPLLLLLCALCCTGCANSFDGTAQAYFRALEKFDYEAMYDLLTPAAQGRVDYEEFVTYHKKVYDLLKVTGVDISRGEKIDHGNYVDYTYTAVYSSSDYGTFSYEMQLEVYKKTKFYMVAWTPANIVPDMNWHDRIFVTTLRGKRGEIFDSSGNVLVKNDYAVTVYASKEKMGSSAPAVLSSAASILGIDTAQIEKAYEETSDTVILATLFKGELKQEQEDALLALDGVRVNRDSMTPIRFYPYGSTLAQTLGYSSPITEKDREKEEYRYLPEGVRIGRSGLEAVYDLLLQPSDGKQIYLLSDDGKRKTVLYEQEAINGKDLQLTVDIILQKGIEEKMAEVYTTQSTGTAVVVEPTSGAIKVLASYPSYDANIYAFDKARGAGELLEDKATPLLNRTVQGLYPPGSIYKSMMALFGLDSGTVTTETVFPYESQIIRYSAVKDGWMPAGSNWSHYIVREAFRNSASGPLTMHRALTWSDNIYFGWLAMKMGKERMKEYAKRLGIGESIPFDLSVKPSQLYTQEDFLDSAKAVADTGFGQGQMLVTPLQLAMCFSLYGNNGTIMQPYILSRICAPNTDTLTPESTTEPKVYKQSIVPAATVSTVRAILENTAKNGTGKSGTRETSIRAAAKTGTAQTSANATGEIGWYAGLVLEGGQPYSLLVSADESDFKFPMVRYIFSQLEYKED